MLKINKTGAVMQGCTAIHEDMEKLRVISAEVNEKVSAMRTASRNIASFMEGVKRLRV